MHYFLLYHFYTYYEFLRVLWSLYHIISDKMNHIHYGNYINNILSAPVWCTGARPNARAILHFSIVWCWGTPSTMVCSGFTAIRFRQKCLWAHGIRPEAYSPGHSPGHIARGGAYPGDIMEALEVCRRINRALIFLFSAPVLSFCYDRHWIQVFRVCPHINHGNIWWSWKW